MSAPFSPIRLFVCDGCQATLPYDPTNAGKKCRCGQCGKILVVPNRLEELEAKPEKLAEPSYIEFWCRVCDTRLVAHAVDSGKKAKCTDCGAVNLVPAPKKQEARREPQAMHGQQYGVWEVNKAPDPETQRAAQPKLFAVYCRVCDTLMYAQHTHVGGKLKCPDCGALTTVKEPPKEAEKKSPLVPAGQEYKLDPTQLIVANAVPEYVERLKRESKVAVEEKARQREDERPKMPRLPTINGVWSMLLKEPVPTWWVGTSAVGIVVAGLAIEAATTTGGGISAMYMLCCIAAAVIIGILFWIAPVAAICCAIVAESSEGHKKLHASPSPWIFESFPEIFFIFFPVALSLIPAFAVMQFVPWQYSTAVGSVSMLVFFPVLLLSTFQESTPMGVFSSRIWGSLALRPAHWLLFYIESAIILAASAITCANIFVFAPGWNLVIVPIALAASFVYFRVLGRFAWWLAESLPEKEDPQIEPRYKRFG